MKLMPETRLSKCSQCVYNHYDACKHPSFDSVMYISLEERCLDFPTWCPLKDVN